MPEEKIPDEAVIFTVPSTASGVIVAEGLLLDKVNACFGEVKVGVENVQGDVLPPLTIYLGDISSWTRIKVSALCVKYIRSRSISPKAQTRKSLPEPLMLVIC